MHSWCNVRLSLNEILVCSRIARQDYSLARRFRLARVFIYFHNATTTFRTQRIRSEGIIVKTHTLRSRRLLVNAFAQWLRRHLYMRYIALDRADRFYQLIAHRLLRDCFQSLRGYVIQRHTKRLRVLDVFVRLAVGQQRRILSAWRGIVLQRQTVDVLAREHQSQLTPHRVRHSLRYWRSWLGVRLFCRQQANLAIAHHRIVLLRKCFAAWLKVSVLSVRLF